MDIAKTWDHLIFIESDEVKYRGKAVPIYSDSFCTYVRLDETRLEF